MYEEFLPLEKLIDKNQDRFVRLYLRDSGLPPRDALIKIFNSLGRDDEEQLVRVLSYLERTYEEVEYAPLLDKGGYLSSSPNLEMAEKRVDVQVAKLFVDLCKMGVDDTPKAWQRMAKRILERWRDTDDDAEAEQLFAAIWRATVEFSHDRDHLALDTLRNVAYNKTSLSRIAVTYRWAKAKADKMHRQVEADRVLDALAVAWAKNRHVQGDFAADLSLVVPLISVSDSARKAAEAMVLQFAERDRQLRAFIEELKKPPVAATLVTARYVIDNSGYPSCSLAVRLETDSASSLKWAVVWDDAWRQIRRLAADWDHKPQLLVRGNIAVCLYRTGTDEILRSS